MDLEFLCHDYARLLLRSVSCQSLGHSDRSLSQLFHPMSLAVASANGQQPLPFLFVNIREDGHHKPASQVREFVLCFRDIPLSLPVHQVLRMLEVQLLGRLRDGNRLEKLHAEASQLVLARAGMTIVDDVHGEIRTVQIARGRNAGIQASQFLTTAQLAAQECAGKGSISNPLTWSPEEPSSVDFAAPFTNPDGKPQIYNLASGDVHLFKEFLGAPFKQLDPAAVQKGEVLYGLVEVQARLCEQLWRAYNGLPRSGADLRAEAHMLFDHRHAVLGWGQTSGRLANPTDDLAVRALIHGAPERIRTDGMQILENLQDLVRQVYADQTQASGGEPAAESLRWALHAALKIKKHQLLLEWHPDKRRQPEEAKLMTQLLIPLFNRIFKVLGHEET